MNDPSTLKHFKLLAALFLIQATVSGCRTCHDQCDTGHCEQHCQDGFLGIDKCSTIPHGAIPVPAGTYLDEWQNTQAAIGEADKFVFYRNEWRDDGTDLGPYGERHLSEILPRVGVDPFHVIIEPSDDPNKDNRRRWNMIAWMSDRGVVGAENLVVLGNPMYVEGLIGEEAELIHDQMIQNRTGNNQGLFGASGAGLGRGFGGFGGIGGIGGIGGVGFRR